MTQLTFCGCAFEMQLKLFLSGFLIEKDQNEILKKKTFKTNWIDKNKRIYTKYVIKKKLKINLKFLLNFKTFWEKSI